MTVMGTSTSDLRALAGLAQARIRRAQRELAEARTLQARLLDAIDQLDTREDTSDEHTRDDQPTCEFATV